MNSVLPASFLRGSRAAQCCGRRLNASLLIGPISCGWFDAMKCPGGTLQTGLEGRAQVLIEGEIRPGRWWRNREPAGGVDVATGEILFSAPRDA